MYMLFIVSVPSLEVVCIGSLPFGIDGLAAL
jgi:hypothetical protein